MSRQHPDKGDQIMLGYRCGKPTCLAFPGEWCRTDRGGFAYQLHASRFYAAYSAGDFPITDSDNEGAQP